MALPAATAGKSQVFPNFRVILGEAKVHNSCLGSSAAPTRSRPAVKAGRGAADRNIGNNLAAMFDDGWRSEL